MRTLENSLRRGGFVFVAGVDEVGRGCLAGPVVAGAVVLDPDRHIPGVCDSKLVPAAERERLYDCILANAVAWSVASADPAEIDGELATLLCACDLPGADTAAAPLPTNLLRPGAR